MTRRPRALAAALLIGMAAGACAVASPAFAAPRAPHASVSGLTLGLVDAPAAAQDNPLARAYILDQLSPGQQIVRHLQVTNGTGQATVVSLYPSAAQVAQGGFLIGTGASPNELTSWTTISPASVPLRAGASQQVTVTITVPAHATSGERYEGLVAALPPAPEGHGLQLENRVAVRTYLSVSSPHSPVPAPDFTISALQAARLGDGTQQVTATVTNTGGRALNLSGTLRLSHGPGGLSAGPFVTTGARSLAIGASGTVSERLDTRIPVGPWTARIDVTNGLLTRSATGTITFPSAAGSRAAPVTAHPVPITRNRHVLALIGAGLIGLVVFGLLLAAWRRTHNDEEQKPPPTPDPEPVGASRG